MRSAIALFVTIWLVGCGGSANKISSADLSSAQTFGPTTAVTPTPTGSTISAAVEQYRNPLQITAPDGGQVESCPDPSIIHGQTPGDSFWYLYCTNERFTDYGVVHLLPISKSDDLVHWIYTSDVFAQMPPWVAADGGLWAPDIRFFNGRYYLYYSVSDTKEGGAAIYVATSGSPVGPWAASSTPVVEPEPAPCCKPLRATIDPAVVEADGLRYIFYGSFNGGISARLLSPDGMRTSSNTQVQITVPDRYEAAYVIQRNGYYYLMVSAGDCCAGQLSGYGVFVGRSLNPLGPYVDRDGNSLLEPRVGGTPVLAMNGNRWIGPGHNAVFTDASGQDWMVYHAVDATNPYFAGSWTRRPVLMDPIDWVDGWPAVRNGNGTSDESSPSAALSATQTGLYTTPLANVDVPAAELPAFSDEFDGDVLQPQWSWLRQPATSSYAVSNGTFRFDTQPGELYVGQHTASVLMEHEPSSDYVVEVKLSMTEPVAGIFNYVQGGVVIYENDDNYIKLVASSINQTRQIEFAKQYGSSDANARYGNCFLASPADATYLRIVKRSRSAGETYTAYSSHDGMAWTKGPTWTHRLGSKAKIGLVSMSGAGFSTFFDYVRVYALAN